MAKVSFLTFYNDYSIAVASLSSELLHSGHDVTAFFFKMPFWERIPWFTKNPIFMEHVKEDGMIYGQSIDVNEMGVIKKQGY